MNEPNEPKPNNEAKHAKTRKLQLCVDRIETLEDVKKILDVMKIRIFTDDPNFESVKDYFQLEIIPKGYVKLYKKIGDKGIAKLHYHEIEREAKKLLDEEENV